MAKMTTASKAARQLGELLQEQQEPFILEVYLTERGCVKKNLTSGANFIGCHGNSGKSLKKSGSQNKSKTGIPHFSVLKVILRNKFFKSKGLKTKNSNDEDGKLCVNGMIIKNQETADRFFSVSGTTVYNSCPDIDIDDEPPMLADNSKYDRKLYDEKEKKSAPTTFEWSYVEENKKHIPHQSVLEEISISTGSQHDNFKTARRVPSPRLFLPKLLKEDSILSSSVLNLILETRPDHKSRCAGSSEQEVPDCCKSSRSSISKRVLLHQTKQLLFGCVRELVENKHDKEERKEFGKVIRCEKIKGWGRRCGEESSIKRLLELGIINSIQEWRTEFESQKRDIGLVIGNALAEEMTSEVIMDIMMINVLRS